MMHQHRWLAAGIIIAAIIAAFIFSVPRTTEIAEDIPAPQIQAVPSVSVKDSFRRGVHTITGTIEAPNACATVSAEGSYEEVETDNEHILIAVNLTIAEGLCLEIPTDMRFTTTVTAPADLPIQVVVNGIPAVLE